MADGAVSLKFPNFLTTSQDVTKGADQANYVIQNKILTGTLTLKSQKYLDPLHIQTLIMIPIYPPNIP